MTHHLLFIPKWLNWLGIRFIFAFAKRNAISYKKASYFPNSWSFCKVCQSCFFSFGLTERFSGWKKALQLPGWSVANIFLLKILKESITVQFESIGVNSELQTISSSNSSSSSKNVCYLFLVYSFLYYLVDFFTILYFWC